jgi:hypothetical protein
MPPCYQAIAGVVRCSRRSPSALARAEGQSLNETVKTALRKAVERRRRDPKFTACVPRIIDEDRELLERLAG